jgi:predicted aspartyl protease
VIHGTVIGLQPRISLILQLPDHSNVEADNSTIAANACFTTILWNEIERDIVVLELGSRPLIGTALLEDYHLSIDFCDGGIVLVDEIL